MTVPGLDSTGETQDKFSLYREPDSLAVPTMKEGESITNYCARTMEICNKMRFHSENMGDVVIAEKILRSLTPKYDYVVCSIEESKDIDVLSLDELQSSLLVHEQKMNRSSTSDEQALKASTFISSSNSRGRGRGRGRGRRRGDHGGRDSCRNFKANNDQSQGKGRGRDYDKSKIECYRCHKFSHYASECYTRLPNDKEKEEKSNYAENKEGFRFKVSFGDCSTVDATGKGDIKIKTKNGFAETISNVLYVPDLKSNLLSVGQLQEKGYVITIKKGECEIYDPVRGAIAIVQMSSNRLFPIKIDSIQSCLMTEVKDPSWLWHFRYGHLSFGGLKTLQEKSMVTGAFVNSPSSSAWFCDPFSIIVENKTFASKGSRVGQLGFSPIEQFIERLLEEGPDYAFVNQVASSVDCFSP
ncbi:PREDICTED: uncharacterized protein LOC109227623 [Nicotiana attenuata]|uniref:uncharacterized protein LOC109227623 n=1 Tax=Nicotiana attenuata TaxID=49451 RepID=UPI000904737F|nr:PREDICTED: uncharacterized protein LOC109227623 [Nicotiana attenuata]